VPNQSEPSAANELKFAKRPERVATASLGGGGGGGDGGSTMANLPASTTGKGGDSGWLDGVRREQEVAAVGGACCSPLV